MTETQKDLTGMYRFTSIARPIDPAYLTNRALLIVLPLIGILSAGLAAFQATDSAPLSAAFVGMLVAFAAWALTRELAPDYYGAAFVALVLAWFGYVAFNVRFVLLVFVALLLARLVNRSTGLPWRLLDTLGVLGLLTWAAINLQQPLILLIASAAFVLDAVLEDPVRRHYAAAAFCLGAFVWMLGGTTDLVAAGLTLLDWSLLAVSALGVVLFAITSQDPVSYCDTSPDRLDRTRVNAGLIIGWLVAVQAVLTGGHSAWLETPIWASVTAVLLVLPGRSFPR
ncbi:MAG: hypothetical protein P8Y01_10500 [Woeseiaceae bacterium]